MILAKWIYEVVQVFSVAFEEHPSLFYTNGSKRVKQSLLLQIDE